MSKIYVLPAYGFVISALLFLGMGMPLPMRAESLHTASPRSAIHQEDEPTETPTPAPTTQIFIPAARSGDVEEKSPSTGPSLIPPQWRPFWRRYGSLIFLLLALGVWELIQQQKSKRK